MAYKCSTCRLWIPREGHARTCPRYVAPPSTVAYDYRCQTCDVVVELRTREPAPCQCGGELKRIYSAPAVTFRGKGFYRTGG